MDTLRASDLTEWKELMLSRIATRKQPTCTIALVGKYVKLHDAYLSVVMESLYHAGL